METTPGEAGIAAEAGDRIVVDADAAPRDSRAMMMDLVHAAADDG